MPANNGAAQILERIERILDGDEPLPERVTNYLIFTALLAVYDKTRELGEYTAGAAEERQELKSCLDIVEAKITHLESQMSGLKAKIEAIPAWVWFAMEKPRQAAGVVIAIFILVSAIYIKESRDFLIELFSKGIAGALK